jgi:hypothetical protein
MVLGPPVQIAYLVDDVRAAANHWAAIYGAGPFFVLDHIAVSDVLFEGKPSEFDHSSAYGQWGEIMVEFVCEHTNLFRGRSGIHHLAYFVEDFDEASLWCSRQGFPQALFARTATEMPFAFHDATVTLGHYIEIYERQPRIDAFYAMVAAASEGWSGTDPVRVLNR